MHNSGKRSKKRYKKRGNRKMSIILVLLGILAILMAMFLIAFSPRDRGLFLQSYKTFNYQGDDRRYLISGPNKVTSDTRIIVGLHGYGDLARKFAYYTGLQNVANDNDLVVYPQAIEPEAGQLNGWNSEFCCGSGWKQGKDDAGFVINLIDSIRDQYKTIKSKVYLVGFSNGSFFAQKIAIDYPKKVDGIAAASGSIGTKSKRLKPNSPMPIILMHGEQDKTVPFNGGAKPSDPDFDWLSFDSTKKAWLEANTDQVETEVKTFPGDGHQWHDWRLFNFWHKQPTGSQQVIEFINRQ